jgi:hypothetical protein
MSEPVEVRARPFAERVAAVALLVLAAAFLLHQLYSAWCAMTWFKYHQGDYGNYVNMLWNTAHGRPFRMNVDENYLTVHLSFTLALLSVFYHVWDHAFLLALLQWLMVAGGAGLVWAMARRRGLAPMATAALVLFFCGYFFTQRVLLSDFHTVATYYLLFPWLCYTMAFRKGWAWLPWLLILGVREDAFAVRAAGDRLLRRGATAGAGGWWLAAAGVAYGVLAVTVLYPWPSMARHLLDHAGQNMTVFNSAVPWTLAEKLWRRGFRPCSGRRCRCWRCWAARRGRPSCSRSPPISPPCSAAIRCSSACSCTTRRPSWSDPHHGHARVPRAGTRERDAGAAPVPRCGARSS